MTAERRMLAAAVVFVAVVLVFVTVRDAEAADPLAKYKAAAVAYFGGAVACPNGNDFTVDWWSGDDRTLDDPAGNKIGSAAGYAFGCVGGISFWWDYWQRLTKSERCALYVHEYAHLLGYEHEPTEVDGDPVDRVFRKLDRRLPKQCRALGGRS